MEHLGIPFLQQMQQNRFPVLFIDKVLQIEPGSHATALKAFTYNEWYFQGHFEDEPVVPGFILLECLTQAFLMTFLSVGDNAGKKTAYISIDQANFSRKVVPGDVLTMRAELQSFKFGVAVGSCTGLVGEQEACRLALKVGIPETINQLLPKFEPQR